MTQNTLHVPDLYAQGRADWQAGTARLDLVADPDYRAGMSAQREAQVDAELLGDGAEAGAREDRNV